MAKKITLSKRPQSFKKVVQIPMIDGSEDAIEFTFKYRTRTEFGQLMDEMTESAKAKSTTEDADESDNAAEESGPKTWREFIGNGIERDAQYVLKIAEGWDLADEFGEKTVIELLDMYPGASKRIADAYSEAVNGNRLGN